MLPYLADVALHEEACHVGLGFDTEDGPKVNCVSNPKVPHFVVEGRRTWVVFEAADASNGLVILVDLVVVADDGHVG